MGGILNRVTWWVATLALIGGLILTVISWRELCSESCAEAHLYEFFGFSFDLLGVVFFSVAILLNLLGRSFLVSMMLAGAIGAEVIFIMIQYKIIGEWCPICLSIASMIFLASLSLSIQYIYSFIKGDRSMAIRNSFRGGSAVICLTLGFFIALFGVAKPEKTFADGTSENEDPIFGNRNSAIEIYIVSDWFCTACKDLEPKWEKMLPKVMDKATVLFIDRNIHPESMNYMPYNLSFMLKEKPKYLKLRNALASLTKTTETPTAQQVQNEIAYLGVTYTPLNFSDIDSGHRFFQGISKTFKVNSTPTVVITNKKKIKAKKLVGSEEITQENILLWIDNLSK
ncbi:vitamin K epoxide reductase family protein [Chlamydiales bacterium]|nr:vitamin K epoxide reductase family protein [Chlamydiales bacterium]